VGPGFVPPIVPQAPAPPPDWRKYAFELAADSTKQLITVATGVIAATGLLSKDLNAGARPWAVGSWVVLTLSVLCGLSVLYNMSGQLSKCASTSTNPDLYDPGITDFSIGQLATFLIGVILMVCAFWAKSPTNPAETKPITIYKYFESPAAANQIPQTDSATTNKPCDCAACCTHKKQGPDKTTPSHTPLEK
jgi:hypothetical protein